MTIYLDMDGVLADFVAGFIEEFGPEAWFCERNERQRKFINTLVGTDFFYRLPAFENAPILVDAVREATGGDWGVISSPLWTDDGVDRINSAYWKTRWLAKHGINPKRLHFTRKKSLFSRRGAVLIDDWTENINEWTAQGGTAFLYDAAEDDVEEVIQKIRELYRQR